MKLTIHLEGKTKADLAKGLQAHLALFGAAAAPTRTRKKDEPEDTVDEEEDEDFGKKTMKKKDLEEDEDELEASDDAEDEEEETDEDDSEEGPTVDFKTLRAAVNKYGEKAPDQMRAILAGFKIKSPKELSAVKNEKHWDGVYRKVMAKLKTSKKK